LVGAILILSSQSTLGQDQQAIMNLFGAIMGQAIQQALRAEWARVPPDQMFCINLGLSKQGASLQQLISAGVPPNDPRLSGLRATCNRIAGSQLRQDVSCPIQGPSGEFISWCNEDFAQKASDGSITRLNREDAIQMALSDQGTITSLFERGDAKVRRMQMIADGISNGEGTCTKFRLR
jgi:hypothetical protein